MSNLLSSFVFTRLLTSVILTNLFAFIFFYALRLPVSITPLIYLSFFAVIFYWVGRVKFRQSSLATDKISLYLLCVTLLLLTLPRLTYLLDWIPENTTLTYSDDYARILEILAMTQNLNYPLLSPSNTNYLFSYYYSTLYPFSIIKLLFPVFTIKETIAFGNLFYYILVLFSIYEVARLIFRDTQKIRLFIFLCTLCGGLDWLIYDYPQKFCLSFAGTYQIEDLYDQAYCQFFSIAGHFEWWQRRFFGNSQISSFYTVLFWSVQHFIAAYSVLLAFTFAFYTKSFKRKIWKLTFILALLISAFFASPFVFIPIPFFLCIHIKLIWKSIRSWYGLLAVIAVMVPLPIFLNKFPEQTFVRADFRLIITENFYIDKLLSLPIYATLIPFIELMSIPIILLMVWRHLNVYEKRYMAISWLFLLSTYIISYANSGNYSMRGMVVPTFVFFIVFTRHWPKFRHYLSAKSYTMLRIIFSILIVLSVVGTLKESSGRLKGAIYRSHMARMIFQLPVPTHFTIPIYRIARNPDIETIHIEDSSDMNRRNIYDFEKFIQGLELSEMTHWEKELLRKPFSFCELGAVQKILQQEMMAEVCEIK